MDALLGAISAIAQLVSPDKIRAIAARIRQVDPLTAQNALVGVVSTPSAVGALDQLVATWRLTAVTSGELASMLLVASHVLSRAVAQQSTELVWTGPTTPFVAARRTEQALLQVINAAESRLFITSFVAYDISTIVKAMNSAIERGVAVSMLLELSQSHGGSISFDAIGKMRSLLPDASLFAWHEKADPYKDGKVHAKVAVADGRLCFITSANLTGHAMDKNMEAGVLISGGEVPRMLDDHLRSMIDMRVIAPA